MTEITKYNLDGTKFSELNKNIILNSLFGLECEMPKYQEAPSLFMGMINIETDKGKGQDYKQINIESNFSDEQIKISWELEELELQVISNWKLDKDNEIWSRKDYIKNISDSNTIVNRCLTRFNFVPSKYEYYCQDSRWSKENQGSWSEIDTTTFELACEKGRTTQIFNPYICIKEKASENTVGFHIVPKGNWVIRGEVKNTADDRKSELIVDMGLSDKELKYILAVNETIELPEILIQNIPSGKPYMETAKLHSYLLNNNLSEKQKVAPVVFNTWFDDFDNLIIPHLEKQIQAAKKVGCEIFVIDAGWYGKGEGFWELQTGDWREKDDKAFFGKMKGFSDKVREEGLEFGIWIEPERVCKGVPIQKEHPEWLIKVSDLYYYPDLSKKEVYDHYLNLILNLIETYEAKWMKVDFNFVMTVDPDNKELYNYLDAYYRMIDEITSKHPELFLEGCSSGAMRTDIETHKHFDSCFISDNASPKQSLRISQGSMLRLPPGTVTKWACIRSAGDNIPLYGTPISQVTENIITPIGAVWGSFERAELDFACRSAMLGMFGCSGDLSSLTDKTLERLKFNIDFFKKWRKSILRSVAYLLTPPSTLDDDKGWVGVQLKDTKSDKGLVYIYRLMDADNQKNFVLRGLDEKAKYRIIDMDGKDGEETIITGKELMDSGLEVTITKHNYCSIFEILKV